MPESSIVPGSLYSKALSGTVAHYQRIRHLLQHLHKHLQFDLCFELYEQGHLCQLACEFSELSLFAKMLQCSDKRHLLHQCYQRLMEHRSQITQLQASAYTNLCHEVLTSDRTKTENTIQLGFLLGGFLSDAGWYTDSEIIFTRCLELCQSVDSVSFWAKELECYLRLLQVQNAYCKFEDASVTFCKAQLVVQKLRKAHPGLNLAALYSEFSVLYFVKSYYNEAYRWSVKALQEIANCEVVPAKTVIEVFRQAAKACVVKREFRQAELLIKQAVQLARDTFGTHHPKYADVLLDYGFFLLNVDNIRQSVKVYENALDIRMKVFGGRNFHVAIAHEDLAYASYVNEYSSGHFYAAKHHAESAMDIMSTLLPADHLLLASSKRVKALILEEIAIDSHDKLREIQQLGEAQELHLSALELARQAFGEINVQTAKHYGNLGRLYQSMHHFEEAEQMHLKAIAIKEQLLGPEDYEVALSVGHLASLYNYDMDKFDKAEALYLRSISIGMKLFGEGYSGLEYDYRGLLRVYGQLRNTEKLYEYTTIFHQWKQLRDTHQENQAHPLQCDDVKETSEVLHEFFSMPLPLDIPAPSITEDPNLPFSP